MKIQNKDILVVIGQSRAGKGTLLSALRGQKIQLFRRKKNLGGIHEKAAKAWFMAPVDEKGQPAESELIDHGSNSHTFVPKIVVKDALYPD